MRLVRLLCPNVRGPVEIFSTGFSVIWHLENFIWHLQNFIWDLQNVMGRFGRCVLELQSEQHQQGRCYHG